MATTAAAARRDVTIPADMTAWVISLRTGAVSAMLALLVAGRVWAHLLVGSLGVLSIADGRRRGRFNSTLLQRAGILAVQAGSVFTVTLPLRLQ